MYRPPPIGGGVLAATGASLMPLQFAAVSLLVPGLLLLVLLLARSRRTSHRHD
ncbi:hypothetical protein ABIA32_000718 [Streptacidiphilus sp. MAP12-20]|uniref:hypothetical protein n=1 Tax=Streptacidiphilus sp. MAP12-20 TaxID=3156299 RepID=UPI003510E9F9